MEPYDRFWYAPRSPAMNYQWGQSNYVRLDRKAVAHVAEHPQVRQNHDSAYC